MKKAKGEYVLVLDDDSYPKTDILNEALQLFENDNTLGIVAFNIMNEEESRSKTCLFQGISYQFYGWRFFSFKETYSSNRRI